MTDTGLQSLTDWLKTTIASIEEMDRQEEDDPMKITVTPEGGVIIDVDDLDTAIQFAKRLRDGVAVAEPVKPVGLSPALSDVHEFLIDNDSPEGISIANLADAFGIKKSAMDQRLRQLRLRSLAGNVDRGMWRAIK